MPKKAAARKGRGAKGGNFFSRAAGRKDDNFYGPVKSHSPKPPSTPESSPVKRSAKSPAKPIRASAKDSFVKDLVYVGMSFQGEGGEEVFKAIKDSCKAIRLNAKRVDDNSGSGFVILEIVDLIEKAEFIIFDLTYERPNVYYELGYTHGVGNSPSNILLLAKDGTNLHFDITPLRVRFYKSTKDLKKIIKKNLIEMMKESRK